jgi:hypothetical protein
MAECYGLNTGNPNKPAWESVSQYCKTHLKPLYPRANLVRTPDVQVELTGIAGGQRSILDKELLDAGQAHLTAQVDTMVQQVRKEGGLVCQVTPAADSYAREAMRRIRGGNPSRGFGPGYAQILAGENGWTKEPVNEDQRKAALDERALRKMAQMQREGRLSKEAVLALDGIVLNPPVHHTDPAHTPLFMWRARMDELAAPVQLAHRIQEVSSRIEELKYISSKPELLRNLNIKIAGAAQQAEEGEPEKNVRSVEDRIRLLQQELDNLQETPNSSAEELQRAEQRYEALLLGKASDAEYQSFLSLSPLTQAAFKSGHPTLPQVKELLSSCGAITCSPSLLLEPRLQQAEKELEAFEEEHCLGLLDTPSKRAENTLLWACFSKTAVPNMLQDFFVAYYTGDMEGHFPPLFKGDKQDDPTWGKLKQMRAARKKENKSSSFVYRQIHRLVKDMLRASQKGGQENLARMERIRQLTAEADLLQIRADVWSQPGSEVGKRVSQETKDQLSARIAAMRSEVTRVEQELEEVVAQHLQQHPGLLQRTYPRWNEERAEIEFQHLNRQQALTPEKRRAAWVEEDMELAKTALYQLIHNQ